MLSDLRYSFRSLGSTPVFTTISVVCIALGIGANTAIFSLLDAALLRYLPVSEPDRLIVVEIVNQEGRGGSSFSYPLFAEFREQSKAAVDVFAYARQDMNLSADSLTDAPFGLAVSDNYFSALRVRASLGRVVTAPDEAAAIVSYRYWQTRFQGDRTIIGRAVTINAVPFTIVGVGPRGFFGTEVGRSPDVFVPLALREQLSPGRRLRQPNSFWLRVMGRLAPGITSPQASAHLEAVYRKHILDLGGTVQPGLRRYFEQRRVAVVSGARGPYGISAQFGTPLRILMAAACTVLLIACANVASLLLARGVARRREIAIRLALGAGRGRLVRQLTTESALLAIAGGSAGLVVGVWTSSTLRTYLTDRVVETPLDARLLGFTLLTSGATALLFGVVPALRATRADLAPALKSGPSPGRTRRQLGRVLIAGQVALSLLLLFGAGLFIRTLANLRTMDPGFRGDHVLVATVNPGLSRYTPDRLRSFYSELLSRTTALAAVRAAAIADRPLLGSIYIDGLSLEGSTDTPEVSVKIAGPRFLDTMGIRLLAGRDFSDGDIGTASKVAIVNETIARKYFSGRTALGQRIGVGGAPDMEIVGVIADTKYGGLRDAIPNTVYLPLEQARFLSAERTLHVRTTGDPEDTIAAVREQIRALDPNLPARVQPFSTIVDANLERERLVATLSGFFASLALILTSIGLYGVLAHSVQRRTREIGIRLSLGAQRAGVMWMVLRGSLTVVVIGIAAGAAVCFWLSGLVRAQLFDVSPYDPATAVGSIGVLMLVAVLAGYAPARRASRVDPVIALRQE